MSPPPIDEALVEDLLINKGLQDSIVQEFDNVLTAVGVVRKGLQHNTRKLEKVVKRMRTADTDKKYNKRRCELYQEVYERVNGRIPVTGTKGELFSDSSSDSEPE